MGKHAARRRATSPLRLAVAVTGLVVGIPVAAVGAKAGLEAHQDLAEPASVTRAGDSASTSPATTSTPRARPRSTVSVEPPQVVVPSLPPLSRAPEPKKGPRGLRAAKKVVPALTFRIGSLNVLGASHTSGRHDRYASGATRIRWAAQVLAGSGLSVVGLQELQPSQYAELRRYAPGWGVWPGPALGRASTANSIIWQADQWQMVESHAISVPYFYGRPIPMPYIKLRNLATGREIWVGNVHNPADAHGNAAGYRARAVSIEASLARQLSADGTPVLFTGDMNDRERYFCPMTADAPMHSASGGGTGSPCAPPDMPGVDWVMGSSPVTFTNYHRVTTGLVTRVTDHGLVYADASLAGGKVSKH